MARRGTGTNPFARLRGHLDAVERRCPECGHEDDEGNWVSITDGQAVHYRYTCPACGHRRQRSIAVSPEA